MCKYKHKPAKTEQVMQLPQTCQTAEGTVKSRNAYADDASRENHREAENATTTANHEQGVTQVISESCRKAINGKRQRDKDQN